MARACPDTTGFSAGERCADAASLFVRALGGLLWCETFILAGIQCFWVLFPASPLAVDNVFGAVFAVSPFLAVLCLGIGALHNGFCQALIRMEAALHWLACCAFSVMIVYALWHDPFSCVVPLAVSVLPWSAALALALAANLSTRLRVRAAEPCTDSGMPSWTIPLLALFWWGATVWLCSGMAVLPLLWTASALLHAVAAPFAARGRAAAAAGAPQARQRCAGWCALQAEVLLWLVFLPVLHIVAAFANPVAGAMVEKTPLFLELHGSPLFFLGIAVFLLAARFRVTPLTHAAVLASFIAVMPGGGWVLPCVAGYALAALFRATLHQGPVMGSFSAALAAVVWVLSFFSFVFSGTLIAFKAGPAILNPLEKWGGVALVALYAAWILTGMLARRGAGGATEKAVSVCVPVLRPAWVWCVLLVTALMPGVLVLLSTAWPPFVLSRPLRQPVGEPMGICHACPDPADPAFQALSDLGAQSVRMNFTWRSIQRGMDIWNDAHFEEDIANALGSGRRIVGVFDYDNNDVEQDPVGRKRDHYVAPSDLGLFTDYVRRVVTRYKDRVHTYEIWNEPDISRFWEGTMAEFCELARRTADAIREADPGANIIGTPMTGPFGVATPRGMEMLHRTGALAKVDRPNGHLYLTHPRYYYNEFWKLIGTARRFGHPGSVCVTELGSPDGGYYPWRSEGDALAAHTIKAYTIGTNLGSTLMNWFCLRDDPTAEQLESPGNSELFFGLLRADNSWKPSAHAYRLFSRNCTRCEIRNDLLRVSGGLAARQLRATLYRRDGGESTLVLWYEPALLPAGTARVRFDLGKLGAPPVLHDIGSEQAKPWLDREIEVSEEPVVMTFRQNGVEQPVVLAATGSPVDLLWLFFLLALAAGSLAASKRAAQ